ncbi:MAG: hypothetical protein IAI50_16160 [Candidatus Eremiobacteraeota bacterium]|nr:hypothetical protein [Candidatus Eremiobacteraeota bacterium]
MPAIGDARGIEAQPLIMPGARTALGLRDVMILPSMADVVRGVDAHDGSAIWQVRLGMPVTGSAEIDEKNINQHWGCISTGVIDQPTQRLYQVCWISPDDSGRPQTARYYMFVLDVGTGKQLVPPTLVAGNSHGQDFNAHMRKQRSSLVETTTNGVKTVFGCAGTILETGDGAAGFCFAYDVAGDRISAMLALSSGAGAGVWMGGQGVVADPEGSLYVITGNGAFDGATQWGESFLKLRYTPPSATASARLSVVDHWTPWSDSARSGQRGGLPAKVAGISAPSDAVARPVGARDAPPLKDARLQATLSDRGVPTVLAFPNIAASAWADGDWGSAGPACIFALDVCVAAGKDGIGYPLRTTDLGGTTGGDLIDAHQNCKKLAAPPVWLTMSPGPVDPCPADPRTLNFFPNGVTAHLHMTPVQYFDPILNSWTLFVCGENSQLHKWKVDSTGRLTYVAQSNEFASADVRGRPPGRMPGGFCSGSSNGNDPRSAILVCTIPYGDANAAVVNGRLLVYDPVHLAADGSIEAIWDSQRFGVSFLFNKFDPPVIDDGQIYVPNYDGGVDVYRLTN